MDRSTLLTSDMVWFSRILAAFSVVVGPAMLVYARSDIGPWTPGLKSVLLSVPWAFHAFAAFGYVAASGLTRTDISTQRTAVAAVGCLLIPFATLAPLAPLAMAVTDFGIEGNYLILGIGFSVLALPTAVFQVLVTGRRTAVAILEILSHQSAMGGVILINGILSRPPVDAIGDRVFVEWPILLALTPFVAMAFVGATAVPLRRLTSACVLVAFPIYLYMSIFEVQDGDGAKAPLWPTRVWSDFLSTKEWLAIRMKATAIQPNVPVRIGEHWYRFERPGVQNAMTSNVRRPDRIAFLQLDIPADDLDLPNMPIRDHRLVQLHIAAKSTPSSEMTQRSPEELERFGDHVAVADRDLVVYVVVPRDRAIDRTEVREKLRRFIRNARVEPPPVPR